MDLDPIRRAADGARAPEASMWMGKLRRARSGLVGYCIGELLRVAAALTCSHRAAEHLLLLANPRRRMLEGEEIDSPNETGH